MSGGFIKISPKDSLAAAMYRREKKVAMSLAQHAAALLAEINHHPTDWTVIYHAAHTRVAREEEDGGPSNTVGS